MSHRIAKQAIVAAKNKLRLHRSGDPQWHLDPEEVEKLEQEIARAEEHLEEKEEIK